MPRFYRVALLAAFAALPPQVAAAQDPPSQPPPSETQPGQPSGVTIPARALADLPNSNTLFGLLDTAHADIISDRIEGGGLGAGRPARLGAHGGTWTQTLFRLGPIDITDGDGSGSPLLLPDLVAWDRIDISTARLGVDVNAAGLAITLQPKRPSSTWSRQISGFFAPIGDEARTNAGQPPPVSQLEGWSNANLFFAGPLVSERLGLVVASSWTKSSEFTRAMPGTIRGSLASLFTSLEFTADHANKVRLVGWLERARQPRDMIRISGEAPAQLADTIHASLQWERMLGANTATTFFGGYAGRLRSPEDSFTSAIVVERLQDGPVPELLNPMNGTDRTWSFGGRMSKPLAGPFGRAQNIVAGIEAGGASARWRTPFAGTIGELVDGVPARVWQYADSGRDSRLHETSFAIYAGDSINVLPRLSLGAGLRFEAVGGAASGATETVSWHNFMPRGSLRWEIPGFTNLSAIADFGHYAYRLPLSYLSYGDPAGPTALIYRWNESSGPTPTLAQMGPLVARIGPGTGGNPDFSRIDPGLHRPDMNDLDLGFELRPGRTSFIRVIGIARNEKQLVEVANVGVPLSAYSPVFVRDPGIDLATPNDDQLLAIFNRSPASFGADRYLLTNVPGDDTNFVGVDATAETTLDHLFLLFGATAGRSSGLAANRGFRATENDQGVVGEVFTNPNATTNSRGRLFTDRGYTLKIAGTYQFPHDVRFGIVGRYQDGQQFARLVVDPDLNQGAEAVRAFPNGRTRFTYTMTFDVRLQKGFTIGTYRFDAILDGFNVFNTANEIEEIDVTGPSSRLTSAVQPPRVVHIGLRVSF